MAGRFYKHRGRPMANRSGWASLCRSKTSLAGWSKRPEIQNSSGAGWPLFAIIRHCCCHGFLHSPDRHLQAAAPPGEGRIA